MTVYTTQHNDRAHAVRACLDNLFSGHCVEVTCDDNGLYTVSIRRVNGKPMSRATKRICNTLTEGIYIADTTGKGLHTVSL